MGKKSLVMMVYHKCHYAEIYNRLGQPAPEKLELSCFVNCLYLYICILKPFVWLNLCMLFLYLAKGTQCVMPACFLRSYSHDYVSVAECSLSSINSFEIEKKIYNLQNPT